MKTLNLTPHVLETETSGVTSTFTLVFEGMTPGGKLQRVRLKLDGPVWVEDLARQLHNYIEHENKKLAAATAALKGT